MFEGPFENVIDFKVYLQNQINDVNGLCFCVFDQATNREIGVFNLMNNYPSHFKIEIGSLWYTPIVQHTQANTEATYLILKHIFELGYHRIEWKCDARNTRSRRAALKMKFKFEGIQESHLIIKGCPHDTAWFRMLQSEWPKNQKRLEKMLYDKKQDQVDHVIWNKTDEATTTNPWTIENFEKRLWILAFGISLLLLFLFYNHNYATDFSMLSSSLISNLLGPMTVCFLVKAIQKKWWKNKRKRDMAYKIIKFTHYLSIIYLICSTTFIALLFISLRIHVSKLFIHIFLATISLRDVINWYCFWNIIFYYLI